MFNTFISLKRIQILNQTSDPMEKTDYRILGLNKVFSEKELTNIDNSQAHVISILSYFATSLFDKNKTDDVLWDITENCISKLDLEDCIIYLLDENKEFLIQKAAFGNKNKGERRILNPITIPRGKGIVGHVAVSGQSEVITDVTQDMRYILDDLQRGSELAVPLLLDDEVIGVIDSEHSEKSFFDINHLFLFELIAQLTVKKLAHIMQNKQDSFTNDNAYYKQFCLLIEEEKIYRDENLSLSSVAERLNISANYLSQLVNKLSDFNFSDFINRYRVEEAKSSLIHPDFENYTITAIGLEAGFNSRSAFYSAFKKYTGLTPTEFSEKNKNVS